MRRFGQEARLKPDKIEEYRRLHASVWPGVLEVITKCNLRNYTIFIAGDRLFSYFEYVGDDYEKDMAFMEADPVTNEWWKLTKPCFLRHEERVYYTDMTGIFHHD